MTCSLKRETEGSLGRADKRSGPPKSLLVDGGVRVNGETCIMRANTRLPGPSPHNMSRWSMKLASSSFNFGLHSWADIYTVHWWFIVLKIAAMDKIQAEVMTKAAIPSLPPVIV